jgi:hypothetical protein
VSEQCSSIVGRQAEHSANVPLEQRDLESHRIRGEGNDDHASSAEGHGMSTAELILELV